jgi:hypothetical protein
LYSADLSYTNLSYANLSGADLYSANLRDADLYSANLYGANLSGANLRYAYLSYANLIGADLYGADLYGADLSGADLYGANLSDFQIPQDVDLIVWKKSVNDIVKLKIPAKAKRTACLINTKCRCEYAEVLEITGPDDLKSYMSVSTHGGVYIVGETIKPDKFDPDIRIDCSNGIHFFMNREEAENW